MAQEHKCPKCAQVFTSEARMKMHEFYKHEKTAAPKADREPEHEPAPKPRAAARPSAKPASGAGRPAAAADDDDDDFGWLND
jgi:hypothetical protein